jgi:hypothetical protein
MDLNYALKQLEHEIRLEAQRLEEKKTQAAQLRALLGFPADTERFQKPEEKKETGKEKK